MILVTGGTGYIGSHTVVVLQQAGYEVLILDNLSNSSIQVLDRIQQITNKKPEFIQGDIRNAQLLENLFKQHPIEAVIHFAGLKAVGESMQEPLKYFDHNINGSIQLLNAMQQAEVQQLVFSSSATVYGDNSESELVETMSTGVPTSNYGYTKLVIEQMLSSLTKSDTNLSVANLRYFNPIGAHPSGLIGEDPLGIPNNLLPFVAQVAIGKRQVLSIFGNDYPTPDGTCIRDYIHVIDLAYGHVKALQYIKNRKGNFVWNLGTGQGHSVLDIINSFEKVTDIKINYQFSPRRAGDLASFWANSQKAKQELEWQPEYTLQDMIQHLWHWQTKNPNGYMT